MSTQDSTGVPKGNGWAERKARCSPEEWEPRLGAGTFPRRLSFAMVVPWRRHRGFLDESNHVSTSDSVPCRNRRKPEKGPEDEITRKHASSDNGYSRLLVPD